ncbi:AraC family transcriptional regulator [Paenibacillus sp. HB172176]|uniref:AraC family transcriptional regulator n=1 Tax=Paenibacillus sp. HB172176 TaxID=2493690 RepID=UPI00143AFAC9|nr:AraC family transcriptional regulator [Paenibacillus sp. HB172176]
MNVTIDKVLHLQYKGRWGGYGEVTKVPHHLLLFMDEGSCSYVIDGETYTVRKGEVLFMAADTPRQGIAADGRSHAKYSVHWKGAGMFEPFPKLNKPAVKFETAAIYGYLNQMYARMHHLCEGKERYCEALCHSMLLEMTVRIHQQTERKRPAGKQATAMKLVHDYIAQYYQEPLSIEELALHAGRNATHLITSFRKQFGKAPLAYMHQLRIARAEELLLSTDARIEDIASELGYCDAAYFSRMFKRLTGMTPSAFRRML